MSIEDKIPAPRITHPNKAALKRKPAIRVWLSGAAAAAVVTALGLGYFFSQWSAPPPIVAENPIVEKSVTHKDTLATTLPEQIVQPEPMKVAESHTKVVAELPKPTRVEPEPIVTIEPVAIETKISVEIQIVPPTIEMPMEQIAAVSEPSAKEAIDDDLPSPERVGYGKEVVDRFRDLPQKLAKMGQESVSNLRHNGERTGYGRDVIESLRNVPQKFAQSKAEHYRLFSKQNKKQEIEI